LPIVHDPNGADGREELGLGGHDDVSVEPFRVLPGDDASCLNLYQPTSPRVLGVRTSFIESGRFAFQSSLASTDAERKNPWLLLNRDLGDTVPAITDANSMTYVLHKKLGDTIVIQRGNHPLRLRLVAALADSIFQSELLISERAFLKAFPDEEGYRFLLVDVPQREQAAQIATAIERGAADLGADAVATAERLAEFHTVENTYISTFQALGGLGLLVGTLGLAAVVLRNVLERRRELALLGAVGYSYSRMRAFLSIRRYKGMLIFHGREKTFGSSIVASYVRWLGVTGVYRSVTWSSSLWKFPARSNQVWSLKSLTSTTSVSPSQRPRESPIQKASASGCGLPSR
jgi:hypothetical protein